MTIAIRTTASLLLSSVICLGVTQLADFIGVGRLESGQNLKKSKVFWPD